MSNFCRLKLRPCTYYMRSLCWAAAVIFLNITILQCVKNSGPIMLTDDINTKNGFGKLFIYLLLFCFLLR